MTKEIIVHNVTKGFVDRQAGLPNWLKLKKRTKFYAVKNTSFSIDKGEIFGILGPNGCGKSTLIRMMSTLLLPDKGTIKVAGFNMIKEPEKIKELINRVSVEASFFKRLSAKENLLYASRLYGIEDKNAIAKFTSILSELGFEKKKINDPMEKFSRGMQQKVAIARGFITDPKIIMLDEPTTGLDPKSKLEVQRFIRRVYQETKITIVISSHDMSEVEKLCDRIAIMDKGNIIAIGTAQELKDLVASENTFELETSNNSKAIKILDLNNSRIETKDGNNKLESKSSGIIFQTNDVDNEIVKITTKLKENNIKFRHLKKVVPTLEDVFLKLTGKSLEDEDEE